MEATDIKAEEPQRPVKRSMPSMMSGAALLISILAMWISIYEINVIRTEERAQVWPYVDVGFRYGDGRVSVTGRNKGTGPAIVKQFAFSVGNAQYFDWLAAFDDLFGEDHGISYQNSLFSGIAGEVMSPDEQITLMSVPLSLAEPFAAYADQVSFSYCYCSVHQDCWQVDGETRAEVAACD